jgi:hypothetical protein
MGLFCRLFKRTQCQRVLSGRTLERALVEDSTPEGIEEV